MFLTQWINYWFTFSSRKKQIDLDFISVRAELYDTGNVRKIKRLKYTLCHKLTGDEIKLSYIVLDFCSEFYVF